MAACSSDTASLGADGSGGGHGAAGDQAANGGMSGGDAMSRDTNTGDAGPDAAPENGGSGADAPQTRCARRPLFPAAMPWNQAIADAAKDPESDLIIAALQSRGWGGGRLQIDFSLDVLCASAQTPLRAFEPTDDFYPDECDSAPVPVPTNGHLEGETGYRCTGDGDCHLIVIAEDSQRLYEQWRVDIDGADYRGGCLAVWQLDRAYGPELRGDQCSSADAAGLPIAPLLFDADEVAGGEIAHAVRFALPNTHLRNRGYVRPATHATGAAKAGADGVPYGARLRLRPDYPLEQLPSEGARVLARALQRYGMILADGGTIALMGQSDQGTEAKWDGLLGPRDLSMMQPNDFELVDAGQRFTWSGDCVLAP